jgi:DNA-binding NarL/FixJ family response regulator
MDPTMPENEVRVAVLEDDRRVREGLGLLLDGSSGFRCVAAWGSAEEALRARLAEAPHVLLLDIGLPGQSGTEAVPALRGKWPDVVALMLTVFEDEERVFQALCNGAVGYLLKRTPPARLLEAVREAQGGGSPMSPEIARKVIVAFQRQPPALPLEASLSERDCALLGLLAKGHGYHDAGAALGITVNTVRNHVRRIYEKLHVHSKSAAVAKALRAGVI